MANALARIPVRPLSYKNRDLALARELIVEYDVGEIWIKLEDGSLMNVTASAPDVIENVIQLLIENKTILNAIEVTYDGKTQTLQESITDIVDWLRNVEGKLPSEEDIAKWNAKLERGDVFDENGVVKLQIPAANVQESDTRVFMTPEEREKLKGIETGANKYVHPSYTEHASGLYKVTVDTTGHVSATEAVTKGDLTGLLGGDANGALMTPAEKEKLSGIADHANNYSHPTFTSKILGFYKVNIESQGHISESIPVTKKDITDLGIPGSLADLNGVEKTNAVSYTVLATSWADDATVSNFPYKYEISHNGTTTKDSVLVNLAYDAIDVASSCGLCATCEVIVDKIILRSNKKPDKDMKIEYWIIKGSEK